MKHAMKFISRIDVRRKNKEIVQSFAAKQFNTLLLSMAMTNLISMSSKYLKYFSLFGITH